VGDSSLERKEGKGPHIVPFPALRPGAGPAGQKGKPALQVIHGLGLGHFTVTKHLHLPAPAKSEVPAQHEPES
jgi:hypothetical protein